MHKYSYLLLAVIFLMGLSVQAGTYTTYMCEKSETINSLQNRYFTSLSNGTGPDRNKKNEYSQIMSELSDLTWHRSGNILLSHILASNSGVVVSSAIQDSTDRSQSCVCIKVGEAAEAASMITLGKSQKASESLELQTRIHEIFSENLGICKNIGF